MFRQAASWKDLSKQFRDGKSSLKIMHCSNPQADIHMERWIHKWDINALFQEFLKAKVNSLFHFSISSAIDLALYIVSSSWRDTFSDLVFKPSCIRPSVVSWNCTLPNVVYLLIDCFEANNFIFPLLLVHISTNISIILVKEESNELNERTYFFAFACIENFYVFLIARSCCLFPKYSVKALAMQLLQWCVLH